MFAGCATGAPSSGWGTEWFGFGTHPPSPSPAPAPSEANATTDLIVVFEDIFYIPKLNLMCGTSPLRFKMLAPVFGLSTECHMPGLCQHVFSNTIFGFSGKVTEAELQKLQTCLPGALYYKEENQIVHKAEDDAFWRPRSLEERREQAGRGALGGRRRMQQGLGGASPLPTLHSFEESVKTDGTEGAPVDAAGVTGGPAMAAPGEKTEVLGTKMWNLDRLDQRDPPLDGKYRYGTAGTTGTGNGTTIYVVDSGIKKDHQEFARWGGGASRAAYGYDFVDNDDNCDDCDGHGTHVAATAIGLTVGVAKAASVVSVRILDCEGSGTISNTVAALDWVAANHAAPAVVTLSLGIQVGSWSRVLEDAVAALVNTHGITVVVAAGNSGVDACYVAPANVPAALTVAASDLATKYNGSGAGEPDGVYKWSNSGPCVKLFAPGVNIYSACGGSSRCAVVDDAAYTYASGTSMAVPHVAGVAAVYLESYPQSTPADVSSAILGAASQGKIGADALPASTANLLLYSRVISDAAVQAASGPSG